MKKRNVGAVTGLAVILGGSLVAAPAQATDGEIGAHVYYPYGEVSGGRATATLDFTSRTTVAYRNFTVRDLCPGDGRPVRARVSWLNTDGTRGTGTWRADTNGCGPDGTNFGTLTLSSAKPVSRASLTVCVYTTSAGNLRCETSAGRDNPYS